MQGATRAAGAVSEGDDEEIEAPDEGRTTLTASSRPAHPPPSGDGLVSTGISGMDAQYGGGLPQGNLVLVTSEPTTATSTFMAQFAGAGLNHDDHVFYFSMERPLRDVQSTIEHFVDDRSKLNLLRIIDGYPKQFKDVPKEALEPLGLGGGDDPLGALEELIIDPTLHGRVRIIIESVTELFDHYPRERVLRALRVLRAVVGRDGSSAMVSMIESLHDERTVTLCKHIADGVIEFHIERKGFGIYPYISVPKMRGVTGSARLLLFKETESGLWLESTKRVY